MYCTIRKQEKSATGTKYMWIRTMALHTLASRFFFQFLLFQDSGFKYILELLFFLSVPYFCKVK